MTTSAREQDVDLFKEEGDDDHGDQTESRFSGVNWSLILSLISLVGVVLLFITQPEDLKQDVDWLLQHASAQGDSLQALTDTVSVREVRLDARLDRHWDRMNDIERTMAVASKVDSIFNIVRGDVTGLQSNVAGFQKVASRIKKLEGEAKQSLDVSKLTREELELLKRTFGDHVALRAKDAHGSQKVASNKNSSSSNGDDWEFVSRVK